MLLLFHNLIDAIELQPTNWPCVFFLPVLLALFVINRFGWTKCIKKLVPPLAFISSLVTVLAAILVCFSYLRANAIYNAYGTLCAMISWMHAQGGPIYSPPSAIAPHSMPYGPCGFLLTGWCQSLLGVGFFSSKLPSFLAQIASWFFFYLALRKKVSEQMAFTLTALVVAMVMSFDPLEFWMRPDPFLAAAVVVGLWISVQTGAWAPFALGVVIGIAVNLKFYAFVFFLVPLALIWRTQKSTPVWTMVAILGVAITFLPFQLPQVSLADYLRILQTDSHTIIQPAYAERSLQWAFVLGMIALGPLYVARSDFDIKASILRSADILGALAVSLLLMVIPSSKDGANPHHLLPLLPVVVFAAACLHRDISKHPLLEHEFSWPGLSLFLSIVIFAEFFNIINTAKQVHAFVRLDRVARREIPELEAVYRGETPCLLFFAPVQVVSTDPHSCRALLVFSGMPIGIDPCASEDYKALGHYEPNLSRFVAELKALHHLPVIFIGTRDQQPFLANSLFAPYDRVFSDAVVDDFRRHFLLKKSTGPFDIYTEIPDEASGKR